MQLYHFLTGADVPKYQAVIPGSCQYAFALRRKGSARGFFHPKLFAIDLLSFLHVPELDGQSWTERRSCVLSSRPDLVSPGKVIQPQDVATADLEAVHVLAAAGF